MLRVCYTVNQYAYECKLRLDDKHLDGQASSLFHHEASNATESLMHCTADVNPMCYSVQQKKTTHNYCGQLQRFSLHGLKQF